MELAWTAVAISVMANAVTIVIAHALVVGEKESCKEAWKLLTKISDRRDALVIENTQLQQRLETIEDALVSRE